MSVREYSKIFISLVICIKDIVRTMRAKFHHHVDALDDHLIKD